jgi:hypothetical protein
MINPVFTLPAGHEARPMRLVLSHAWTPDWKPYRGRRVMWAFYGRDEQGFTVQARTPDGKLLGSIPFDTRAEAQTWAKAAGLPAYAVWNGRAKRYDGLDAAYAAMAEPRPMTPEQAYAEDVRRSPTYHTGEPRRSWAQLSDVERSSWVKNPTPRD